MVGAFAKDPQRKREGEPVCKEAIGPAPDWFDEEEIYAWDFLVAGAVAGVLTRMDSAYLALCARSLAVTWKGEVNVTEMNKAGVMLGKLGMTPSERSRVVVPKKPGEDEYGGFTPA